MADLKIPILNKNSNKFFLRKKLTLRRKSKRKLFKEFIFMFLFGFLIIYLNSFITDKNIIIKNFFSNLNKLIDPFIELISYFYEIFLALIIIISLTFSIILFLGGFLRLLKILNKKYK